MGTHALFKEIVYTDTLGQGKPMISFIRPRFPAKPLGWALVCSIASRMFSPAPPLTSRRPPILILDNRCPRDVLSALLDVDASDAPHKVVRPREADDERTLYHLRALRYRRPGVEPYICTGQGQRSGTGITCLCDKSMKYDQM